MRSGPLAHLIQSSISRACLILQLFAKDRIEASTQRDKCQGTTSVVPLKAQKTNFLAPQARAQQSEARKGLVPHLRRSKSNPTPTQGFRAWARLFRPF